MPADGCQFSAGIAGYYRVLVTAVEIDTTGPYTLTID